MKPRMIIRLRRMRGLGHSISHCARMCRMDPKTAVRYLDESVPIRKVKEPRTYRTRKDPIEPFWPEIEAMLSNDKLLKPYAIFEFLRDKHKDAFAATYQRSLERRIAQWRIDNQVEKEVTFDQIHWPADVLAMDFTDMTPLAVTIGGQSFEHKVFHSALTYSNWEYAQVCFSESFEAVADGLQNSFQSIGGVTNRVRFDSFSAAVNNLTTDKQFRTNFKSLLEHLGIKPHRINVRSPNENGDCESLHGHFKDYVDQRLRLRGSREFDSIDEYKTFLKECLARRNDSRRDAFKEEQLELESLPATLFPTYTTLEVRVKSNAIITVKQNSYAVPSCYIGFKVQVRIYADTIELWYLSKMQLQIPRLIGKGNDSIDASTQPIRTGFPFAATSVADDESRSSELGATSGSRELEPSGFLGRVDVDGVPYQDRESSSPSSETIQAATLQVMGADQLESNSAIGSATDGSTADGRVSETNEQCSSVRTPGLGKNLVANGTRRSPASRRSHRVLDLMRIARPTSSACEEGATATAVAEQAWPSLGVDHRRPWICSTDTRRDGSSFYTDSRTLREDEYSFKFKSSVLEMGEHLQGPDDNGCGHRSTRSPQYDSGAEHTKLPIRRSEHGTPETISFLRTENFHCGFLIVAKVEM